MRYMFLWEGIRLLGVNLRTGEGDSSYPFQIPIWRNGNQKLMLNTLIDLKFWVGFEIFPDGCFRIVDIPPRAIIVKKQD